MVVSPGLLTNVSGLIRLGHPVLRPSSLKFSVESNRVSYKHVVGFCTATRQSPSFHDELPKDPFWFRSSRSFFSFMAEQPSQLKYIEWPSFTTTLKTATLSLLLVAVFIVALSSVDSALCYILALILRKAP